MDFTKTRTLDRGERLFREREPSDDVYFLRIGTLLVVKGETLIGQIVSPSFVGELGPILNSPRTTSVIAKTPCSLDLYDGQALMGKLTLQSDLGCKFLRSISERYEMVRDRVGEYQNLVVFECMRILSVHMSEQKVADKKLDFSDIKNVRRDIEVMLEQMIGRKDAVEDLNTLFKVAQQYGVKDKFKNDMTVRFRAFQPLDLKQFKIQRVESYPDFRSAAQFIADKIVVLTRYIADFQTMGLAQLESEARLVEESIPFQDRVHILKQLVLSKYSHGSLDEFKRLMTDFDRTVKLIAEEPGYETQPISPLAKKFNLDVQYVQSLQTKWKEFLMK